MISLLLTLALFGSLARSAQNDSVDEKCANEVWPVGDPRNCQNKLKVKSSATKLTLGVVPGSGWDNLKNTELGLVVDYNYEACRQTPDGKHLVPDNCNAQAKNSYAAQQSQETIDTWLKSTAVSSRSVNLGLDLFLPGVAKLSGSFSYEKTNLRSKMMMTNTVTVRASVSMEKYDIVLQPDSPLSPEFKKRIMSIADLFEKKNTELARYEAQLLVRDFGTHFINSMKVGATIFKEDFIKRDTATEIEKKSSSVGLEANGQVSFIKYNNLTVTANNKLSKDSMTENLKMYESGTTHSTITSHGGAISEMASNNFTEWSNGVDENLVVLDRGGSPLFYIITPSVLPELSANVVSGVAELVKESVQLYYKMNAVKGCTDVDSRNYNPYANADDDGACNANQDKYYFGGVYQTCEGEGDVDRLKPCSVHEIKNFKTQALSCPAGFQKRYLAKGSKLYTLEGEITDTCFLVGKCTEKKTWKAVAHMKLFWCSSSNQSDGSLLFGGIFSETVRNSVTDEKKCPVNFQEKEILSDSKICLADRGPPRKSDAISPKDKRKDIPFGGLFTNSECGSGNPFTKSNYTCPQGYVPVATNEFDKCTVYFCTKRSASFAFQSLRGPPFMLPPPDFRQSEYGLIPRKSSAPFNLSKKETAYLCAAIFGVTLFMSALAWFIIRMAKRRRYKRELSKVSNVSAPKRDLTQRRSSTSV